MPDDESKTPTKTKRRWKRWLLIIPILLIAALLWLNGPGLRYIAPMAAKHFLEKAGIEGDFKVNGSVTGGLSLSDFSISNKKGALAGLTIDKIEPHYKLSGLVKGKIEGLTVEGVHADVRLDPQPKEKDKPPLNLKDLVKTIKSARAQAIPLDLDVSDVSVTATKEDKPQFTLANSHISHKAGSSRFDLDLGELTDPSGQVHPAQASGIVWEPEEISIDKLDPLPGIGFRDLKLALPEGGEPSLDTQMLVGDATLAVTTTPGFADAKVDLTKGSIAISEVAKRFGVEIPVQAKVTALFLDAQNLMPDPKLATGTIKLGLNDISYTDWAANTLTLNAKFDAATGSGSAKATIDTVTYPDLTAHGLTLDADVSNALDLAKTTGTVKLALADATYTDWKADNLTLDATLDEKSATVALKSGALGTNLALDATAPVTREGSKFLLGDATGSFNLESVPLALRELASKVPALDPLAPVPASSLGGNFAATFEENQPQSANADISLTPVDPTAATAVNIKGAWTPEGPVTVAATLDGLKIDAEYAIESSAYRANLALDGFTTTRIEPWLTVAKVTLPGTAEVTGTLKGEGDAKAGTHRGELRLAQAKWLRPDAEPIFASGGVDYDWPKSASTDDLTVKLGEQKIALAATYSDNVFALKNLLWTDGATELAEGSAKLPVPKDFANWKTELPRDTRPVQLDIHSRKLSLGLLKQWVPALEKIDPASTGQLDIAISGSYADPEIDAKLDVRDLRSPDQPKLPPADLKIEVAGRDGRLKVNGSAIAPDFAPAEFKADMPFRPGDWAENPELVKQEPIDARLDLPRLDISRFASLVPSAQSVNGIFTGNVVVKGTLAKPEIKGSLDLANAGLRFKNDEFPEIEKGAISIEAGLDKLTLKTLRATVAGGTIDGGGSVSIADGKLGPLDFRFRGDHLPVVRNESLIVRANANLRLTGPYETATLSGTVGIVDSIFFRDIELLPIGKPFTGPAAADLPKIDTPKTPGSSVPAPFGDWKLDVTARTEQPFLVRGNLATGEATGNIRVGGTIANPKPIGTVKIRDFVATLPFSTLKVAAGTVEFTAASGLDPVLEIRGTAEPRPYTVNVYVYGRASDPQILLTSNPPLPETEIMTLLATGTTTSGLEDPQAAQSRALQLLVEELRRGRFRFGKKLRPVLALLDDVDFSVAESDPYSSESFSTATLSITDHYYLSAGVGETGNSRFLAIWRLSFR